MGCGAALLAAFTPLAVAKDERAVVTQNATARTATAQVVDWDVAFKDESAGRPVHFAAEYRDGHGVSHRLEEWREGTAHVRRRTDDRIDLHADVIESGSHERPAKGQVEEYVWQVIDLQKKIAHRMSTRGMLRAGMSYHFWSTAHVLLRPTGPVRVTRLRDGTELHVGPTGCKWFRVEADGQPPSKVCWSRAIGAPLSIDAPDSAGKWTNTFEVKTIDRSAIAPSVFAVSTAGLQVRNVDELAAED